MQSHEFEELLSANDQLASLSRLGVRFDLGLGANGSDISQEVQRINADVARKLSQGSSLDTALRDVQQERERQYAGTMRYALAASDWSTALDRSREIAQAGNTAWRSIWSGMMYPLLVCVLAYAGLVGFCFYLVPTLQSIYSDLRLPIETWVGVMSWLRSNLWWWAWIPPIVLAVTIFWLRTRLPSKIVTDSNLKWIRQAKFADMLGDLIGNQVPLDQALAISQAACSDDATNTPGVTKVPASQSGAPGRDELPPLIGWVIAQPDDPKLKAEILHAAADSYRNLATTKALRLERRSILLPCVLIGGGAALLYGLALFLPLVELLLTLAAESASTAFN